VLEAMQRDSATPLQTLRVDGGASANNQMMQFQADILGVSVVRPKVAETTALGAAYLAGLAVGFWQNQDEISQLWQVGKRFEPCMSLDERETRMHLWKKAVQRSLAWNSSE
jgi:glycerol kinase